MVYYNGKNTHLVATLVVVLATVTVSTLGVAFLVVTVTVKGELRVVILSELWVAVVTVVVVAVTFTEGFVVTLVVRTVVDVNSANVEYF